MILSLILLVAVVVGVIVWLRQPEPPRPKPKAYSLDRSWNYTMPEDARKNGLTDSWRRSRL